jgi:hypothetical protein
MSDAVVGKPVAIMIDLPPFVLKVRVGEHGRADVVDTYISFLQPAGTNYVLEDVHLPSHAIDQLLKFFEDVRAYDATLLLKAKGPNAD